MKLFVEGLPIAGIGFLIVFFVLAIIWGVLELMKFIAQVGTKKNNKADVTENTVMPVNNTDDDVDEEELVAVLTAAIAASLNTSTYNLKIKSFRRIGNASPAWNDMSRKENTETIF